MNKLILSLIILLYLLNISSACEIPYKFAEENNCMLRTPYSHQDYNYECFVEGKGSNVANGDINTILGGIDTELSSHSESYNQANVCNMEQSNHYNPKIYKVLLRYYN